ncbi:hypothetical protein ACGFYA_36290, partial [Streptomyces sp. NPDC048305]|uniref:hypothetical protein n=1 Tax=Streptomyces sp. NPDC048305 TaxID=3365532 RepID=UPI003715C67E
PLPQKLRAPHALRPAPANSPVTRSVATLKRLRERGGRVLYLELKASQEARLQRNRGASRLAEKPSKRDLDASQRRLLDLDERHRLNSTTEFQDRTDYLRIDNTHLSPEDVAKQVIEHFNIDG